MAPPARAEAIPPAIAPNIITSLKWLETNNLFNNLIQRNQSAALDRKSGSAGMPRPISYAVFCLKKKKTIAARRTIPLNRLHQRKRTDGRRGRTDQCRIQKEWRE